MTRYEPMGTSSAVASALHSGGKRHNKIEATAEISFDHPPTAKLISREQAIEVAKQLVEKYEKLDDDARIDVAGATTDILSLGFDIWSARNVNCRTSFSATVGNA